MPEYLYTKESTKSFRIQNKLLDELKDNYFQILFDLIIEITNNKEVTLMQSWLCRRIK
ncbi:MAG UNVERIFIED_CONTAM: hypothetical protein LVQ98_07970 [Rickettsiaceae bacterium]|jgi:hypothetical protein